MSTMAAKDPATEPSRPTTVRRLRAAAPQPVKRAALPVKRAFWTSTQSARMLPDFLIIGAQKAGTSSLYAYLTENPAIPRAVTKEVHYFDLNYFRGESWYRSHFPTRIRAAAQRRLRGVELTPCEATPFYLFHPQAPRRMRETLPDARLVVLLREPVERALSHYHHEVAMGNETLSFEEAIEREPERLEGELERVLADPAYPAFNLQTFSYLSRGRYAEQLARWFEHFDRDRFLVLDSAGFYTEPEATVRRVCEFVGVNPHRASACKAFGARDYPALAPDFVQRLERYFAPHNARLFEMLGEDWQWPR